MNAVLSGADLTRAPVRMRPPLSRQIGIGRVKTGERLPGIRASVTRPGGDRRRQAGQQINRPAELGG